MSFSWGWKHTHKICLHQNPIVKSLQIKSLININSHTFNVHSSVKNTITISITKVLLFNVKTQVRINTNVCKQHKDLKSDSIHDKSEIYTQYFLLTGLIGIPLNIFIGLNPLFLYFYTFLILKTLDIYQILQSLKRTRLLD